MQEAKPFMVEGMWWERAEALAAKLVDDKGLRDAKEHARDQQQSAQGDEREFWTWVRATLETSY